jgi:L-fucose mutarotase
MLKGISPIISPELLSILARMGHGDELVLADAHFPGETFGRRLVRADGHKIEDLIEAILPLWELDAYVATPLCMMAPVEGDTLDPAVEAAYLKAVHATHPWVTTVERLERFAFYERAREAFAVVMTGGLAKYGNVILKKGVILPE